MWMPQEASVASCQLPSHRKSQASLATGRQLLPLHLMLLHGSVAQQVVALPPALESCGHFTLLFILLLIFSLSLLLLLPSSACLSLSFASWYLCRALQIITTATKVSQVQKEALRQSERHRSGTALDEGSGVWGANGHLMKRNDNKLFKHYLRFHISVCTAFPFPFLLLLFLLLLLTSCLFACFFCSGA